MPESWSETHGRGKPRGRAARVRAPRARDHASPAQDREDRQRARSPARRRPRVPRQVDPRRGRRRAALPRPARRISRRDSRSPARRTRRWSGSPTPRASAQADTEPDLRGVALRVQVSPEESHDLLMTNYPVSHARDAHQFVEFAKATAGGSVSRLLGIARAGQAASASTRPMRMLKNVMTGRRRTGRRASPPRRTGAAAR